MKRLMNLTAALLMIVSTACGSNPTGPSNNTIPNVSGNYTGTLTITFPELRETHTCRGTTTVSQATGGRVSIAPLQLSPGAAECAGLSVPFGDMTIDATGSMGSGSVSGLYVPSVCTNGTFNASASGGFYDRSLKASLVYTSAVCYNMTLTIDVAR